MNLKKAIILHEQITDANAFDQQDSISQAQEIQKALWENGYESCIMAFSINIEDLKKQIQKIFPEFVFNLVDGDYPFAQLAPIYLEQLRIPFTGCSSEAIFITTHKIFTKKLLSNSHIPTPEFFSEYDSSLTDWKEKFFIIKPYNMDSSIGIGKDAIIQANSMDDIIKAISEKEKKFKRKFFAEEFIRGREFHVAMIGSRKKYHILHPIEIQFLNYPEGKHKILNYAAKWEESSFEYQNTQRNFDFPEKDEKLLDQLKKIGDECWQLFGLNGYARLDIRVNEQGQPFVLEVNCNPNITTVGGFAAACQKSGWNYNQMIQMIVNQANY